MRNSKLLITVYKTLENKYVLKKGENLYWTGLVSDKWESENSNKLWKTDDEELIHIIENLVNYSYKKGKSVKQTLLKIIK